MQTKSESRIRTFARSLVRYRSILVTTHFLPDGDGLGSQIALILALRKLGIAAHAINASETPEKFSVVDPHGEIRIFTDGAALPRVDAIVVVDTSDMKLLGPLRQPLEAMGVPIVFIDHHVVEAAEPAEISAYLIDESYSSTGELTFSLLNELGVEIDLPIALALYVALITDTESFRFRRTGPRSHQMAAVLLAKGVQPEVVYRRIYAQDSIEKLRFLGYVLESSQFSEDRKIAWLVVPSAERKRFGATIEDTESFISHLTLVKGVEVALLFREEEDKRIKVSLRGNGEIPVFEIARQFGGGGHRYSAGMRVSGSLSETTRDVLSAVETLVRSRLAP